MNRHIIAFVFLLQITSVVFAQKKSLPIFKGRIADVNTALLKTKFYHFSAIQLETKKLSELTHQNAVSSFRLNLGNDKEWDIDLEPSAIPTSDYRLKVLTPDGVQIVSSHPDFLFKGKVKGSNKNEQVRLAIKEGLIYGSIQADGKEYFIEPLSRFTSAKEKDQYIVYEANDVKDNESFTCGIRAEGSGLKKPEQQKGLREQSPQDVICKKIKFISVADYSVYQKFGNDVHAVETALLANLNLAEGAYSTLNFSADGSTDVGTDKLQFEMEEIVVSTCKECDVAPGEEGAPAIGSKLLDWAAKNIAEKSGKIIQHWTTNPLFDLAGKALSGTIASQLNCSGIGGEILRYGTDDPSFLRVLVAHETGHLFGCPHDDNVKADVTGFIMYSGANGSRTRFSTLADFGGLNFSSQQTIRDRVLSIDCLQDCSVNSCAEVKDLKIEYGNFDGLQLSWTGSGNYLTRYKMNDSSFYDPASIKQTDLNSISLKGLEPCTLYKFEIQRICGASYSKSSSIIFKTSSLNVVAKPINIHGDRYDLELNVDCKNCSDKRYFIKIDAIPYKISNNNNLNQIIVKDLFADGARHRINMSKDSVNQVCTAAVFYTAPYYRSAYTKLLDGNFNDCKLPAGWKDSLLAKYRPSSPDARWLFSQQNFYTSRTTRGSLDSTCMLYFNNFNTSNNAYSGALMLTTPKIDLTKYTDIKLHYDYNFLAYKFSTPVGSITVEVFDGTTWQKIMERQGDASATLLKNIWDSLPSRVFADLDPYKNKDFQLRFIVDDGSLIQRSTLGVFAAFDNIMIDGYLKDSAGRNNIIVYPNPVNKELFIRFEQQPILNINYHIADVDGRIVSKGKLDNYRINMSMLSKGMYLLELFVDDKILTTKKVLKQ